MEYTLAKSLQLTRRAILVTLALSVITKGAAPSRVHGLIRTDRTFALEGQKHPLLRSAKDLGETESSFALSRLELHFKLSPAQREDLKKLLSAQRDRRSELYHKWLTPEQFGARFGISKADAGKVTAWLQGAGFSDVELSRSRNFVKMSGSAAHVRNAFGTAIHHYNLNGGTFYANSENPVLPLALREVVGGLRGLTNYRAKPFIARAPRPHITIGINGNHFLGPDDLATIYNLQTLYSAGTDGTGQKIAVVGQSDINTADIEAFQTAAGLPIKDPEVVMAGEDPGFDADNESEADLDLEWAGAVARGATVIYVNSPDALASAQYAIEQNLAPVISISYGLCESAIPASDIQTYNAAFEQANAQGITIVASSGDRGAAACDESRDVNGNPESAAQYGPAVSFPASSPYVTAVGGTEFDDAKGSFWSSDGKALSYIPELAWNDTPTVKVLAGSGGGSSVLFEKPAWQLGNGVPADGFRDVPDVALSSSSVHDAYLICSEGSCSNGFAPPVNRLDFVGGTSCAAPVFAGILALLNQHTQGTQGNINPGLYSLASLDTKAFHDVKLGDNRVPCLAGSPGCTNGFLGYTAGLGYDQVTGLGSVDAAQLIDDWGSDFQVAVAPAALSVAPGSSGTANIEVTRFANFSGVVSFSCSVAGSLTDTSCSIPGPVSGSGTTALTVSNSSVANGETAHWRFPHLAGYEEWLLLSAAGVLLYCGRRRLKLPIAFAAVCLSMLNGCGGGNAGSTSISMGSQPLTGDITITATSGVLQHAITVPVTITAGN